MARSQAIQAGASSSGSREAAAAVEGLSGGLPRRPLFEGGGDGLGGGCGLLSGLGRGRGRAGRPVGGPGGEGVPDDPRGAAAQATQFDGGGEPEVSAAGARGALDEGVLEEREQGRGGQRRAGQAGEEAKEDARRGQREGASGAVVGDQAPAVELGGDAAGEGAVGGDEGGALAVGGGTAEDEGDGEGLGAGVGGLDPVERGAGRGEAAGEGGALAAPLVGDRGGAQRERDEGVAVGGGRRRRVPRGHGGGIEAEGVGEAAEAVLRVVGGARFVGAEALPDVRGQIAVVAGQDDGSLRQAGDGGHEDPRRAARAGRAGDEDRVRRWRLRPAGGEGLGGGAQAALPAPAAGRAGVVADQVEEAQAALPVLGVLGGIDAGEGLGAVALALEFVEEVAEAVGEVEGRGRAGELGLGGDQPADEAGEVELAAQRRGRGGQGQRQARLVGKLGDDADAGQQSRGTGGEGGGEGALGAAGVHPDLDAGHRLGRLAGEAGVEAGGEGAGEIDAGREREDPRPGLGREEGHRASSASARAMPSGRPTSTQPPRWTTP